VKIFSSKSSRNLNKDNVGARHKAGKKKKKPLFYVLLVSVAAVCAFFIIVGVRDLLAIHFEDAAARSEYDQLRTIFFNPDDQGGGTSGAPPTDDSADAYDEPDGDEDDYDDEPPPQQRLSMDKLAEINSDLVGWISIENHIEYPVVRGRNNDKYMYTTFSGERNNAGAIFMDYRNQGGFDDTVAIIFGHRTRNRTMFSSLNNYLNQSFLRDNPIITITTLDGDDLTYRIFTAKLTDAWDNAYTAAFTNPSRASSNFPNLPSGASRFLLLSTCTPSADRDERVIVYAALEE